MVDFVFFDGPVLQSESQWLGLGAFFPSPTQTFLLSSANSYVTADPISFSKIEYLGNIDDQNQTTLNASTVNRIVFYDLADNVLLEINGLDLTFAEVDLSVFSLSDLIGDGSRIYGTSFSDTLVGSDGDQVLNGGEGSDVATFAGAASGYSIGLVGAGIRISDLDAFAGGDDGSDLLSNIEALAFADVTLQVSLTSPEMALTPGTATSDFLPVYDLAPVPGGGFVITYSDGFSGSGFFQRYGGDGTLDGAAVPISDSHVGSQLAVNPSGEFLAIWSEYPNGASSTEIFGQRFDASGAEVGSTFQINLGTSGNQNADDVVFLSDGRFVVTWTSVIDTYDYDIYARVFAADGTPEGLDFRVNDNTLNFQQNSSLVALPDGGFAVSWSSGWVPFYSSLKIYDSELNGGPEITTNSATDAIRGSTSITTTQTGDILVAWASFAQRGVYARLYDDAGLPISDEFLVRATSPDVSSPTAVKATIDSDGNILIAWLEHDGKVFGQWLDPALNLDGEAFLLSTTPRAEKPMLATMSDGTVLATWWSRDSDTQIFGQTLAAPGSAEFGIEITGTADSDTITGAEGMQIMFGLEGDDVLLGGTDGDMIEGGAGNDFLSGDGDNALQIEYFDL